VPLMGYACRAAVLPACTTTALMSCTLLTRTKEGCTAARQGLWVICRHDWLPAHVSYRSSQVMDV
jgi:hypothetical protein